MTETQIKSLVEEWKRLDELLDHERSKPDMSMAAVNYCEQKMARIEKQFQDADLDLTNWI